MRLTAEPAFVLHARPWRETSLLVEVLSGRPRAAGPGGARRAGAEAPCAARRAAAAAVDPAGCRAARRTGAARRGRGRRRRAAAGRRSDAGGLLPQRADPAPGAAPGPAARAVRMPMRSRASGCGPSEPLAWTLRRFERDLLDALGCRVRLAAWTATACRSIRPRAIGWSLNMVPRRLLSDRGQADRARCRHGPRAAGAGGRCAARRRRHGRPAPRAARRACPSPGSARAQVMGDAGGACAARLGRPYARPRGLIPHPVDAPMGPGPQSLACEASSCGLGAACRVAAMAALKASSALASACCASSARTA